MNNEKSRFLSPFNISFIYMGLSVIGAWVHITYFIAAIIIIIQIQIYVVVARCNHIRAQNNQYVHRENVNISIPTMRIWWGLLGSHAHWNYMPNDILNMYHLIYICSNSYAKCIYIVNNISIIIQVLQFRTKYSAIYYNIRVLIWEFIALCCMFVTIYAST